MMMRTRIGCVAAMVAVWMGCGVALAADGAAAGEWKYIDPAQLDVPWPKHSSYKQPWRAYLETRSGLDFLNGVGVNYHVPGNDELAVRLLAETGFRAFRWEIGWGSVSWDEEHLNGEERLKRVARLIKQYGIRPTLLLNAHQGVPCPVKFFNKQLAADAPAGSRTIKLADTRELVVGRSGLSGLTDYWAAEALITAIDEKSGDCTLSKPLPKALKAGNVSMATLKYLPLYPVGTKEFDQTAEGWVRYAMLVCKLASDAGIEDFDVEIWNELTFGTKFLDINNYHSPKIVAKVPDQLNSGGSCWEIGRRTVEAVKAKYPKARCIWGFSNTTFYHCPIDKLPPRMDGQSYHPYGTGLRSLPQQETHKDRPEFNVEGYTPRLEIRMSEGWAQTFIQTECLIRHLNPEARKRAPAGTGRFYHYITEHGVVPGECGINDEAGAWELKTKCALRSFCMYLNKGLDVMHYFQAWDKSLGMGLLPLDLAKLPGDARFEEVATPPMKAIRSLTRAFGGSVAVERPVKLTVDVAAAGPIGRIFDGDEKHPPLSHRDVFAFLPWQVNEHKVVAAVYVMTYDVTRKMPEERYRLRIGGLPQRPGKVTLYDPVGDRQIAVEVIGWKEGVLEVEVPVSDCPRVMGIEY